MMVSAILRFFLLAYRSIVLKVEGYLEWASFIFFS